MANLLSGLRDAEPRIDPFIRGAWRLYHVWRKNELTEQSTPAKEAWVHALAGLALHWELPAIAALLWLSFKCLLRTGEAANLRYGDFLFTKSDVAHIQLHYTKSGSRFGREEAVVLNSPCLVRFLQALQDNKQPGQLGRWRGEGLAAAL